MSCPEMLDEFEERCNDSDTKQVTCPECFNVFDGELPKHLAGEEECTNCETAFIVAAE